MSLTNETTWFADCSAASWPTSVWFAGFVGFGVQLYAVETYGGPVRSVSSACVQPVVPIAGKVVLYGPEPPSVSAFENEKLPAALLL